MAVSELVLVRHGESMGNSAAEAAHAAAADVIEVGHRDADVPLSGVGVEQAQALGLVTRVSTVEGLDELLAEYTKALADNAPLTVAAGKAITREILKPSPELDQVLCAALIRGCFESADYTEGRTAFMHKRKPVFTGR